MKKFVLICLWVILHQAHALAVTPQPCGADSIKSNKTLKVNESGAVLHSAPDQNSDKLINEKATQITKTVKFLNIDQTTTVLEECTQGVWSRVRVKEPTWLKDSHIGWVPSGSLRLQGKNSAGGVEFTEADFILDKNTRPYREIVIAGVNKLHRENPLCKIIDTASASISSSQGKPSNPVFFVTCGSGVKMQNVFFSKSDIEKQ